MAPSPQTAATLPLPVETLRQLDGWNVPTAEDAMIERATKAAGLGEITPNKSKEAFKLSDLDLSAIPDGPRISYNSIGTAAEKLGKDPDYLPEEFSIPFGPDTLRMSAGRKAIYLIALRTHAIHTRAARAIGVSPAVVMNARRNDELFDNAVMSVDVIVDTMIEDELLERAIHGTEKNVYKVVRNRITGEEEVVTLTTREKSNELLMFVAKARMPDRYGNKQTIDVTQKTGVLIVERIPDRASFEREAQEVLAAQQRRIKQIEADVVERAENASRAS